MTPAMIVAIVQLAVLAIPFITQIIQTVEDMVNQAKASGTVTAVSGADKLSAALGFFQQLWPTLAQTGTGAKIVAVLSPQQITDAVTSLINGAVTMANSLGIFKNSTPAPAAPSA